MEEVCELCGRAGVVTTEHHLIPREEGGKNGPVAMLCIPCHKQIHALYTNRELAVRLYTIEKLRSDEKVNRYLGWIQRQPSASSVKIKNSRERRVKGR